ADSVFSWSTAAHVSAMDLNFCTFSESSALLLSEARSSSALRNRLSSRSARASYWKFRVACAPPFGACSARSTKPLVAGRNSDHTVATRPPKSFMITKNLPGVGKLERRTIREAEGKDYRVVTDSACVLIFVLSTLSLTPHN